VAAPSNFDLICISSGGNLHMKNMTSLPIVLFCFAFLTAAYRLDLRFATIRLNPQKYAN
jgi:hypothetical protein